MTLEKTDRKKFLLDLIINDIQPKINDILLYKDLLIYKDLLNDIIRHYNSQKQGTVSTKTRSNDINDKSGNYLLHKDLLRHHNSQKQGTVSTKTRSEVRGGGRKPWRQKGTGRARAGSNRSPLWKGGGVTFGPKPKIITSKLNKKERQLALEILLRNKIIRNHIGVSISVSKFFIINKTKNFLEICQNCGINSDQKLLVIVSKKTIPLKLVTQNLKNVELISRSNLNTFSILKAKQILYIC